MIVQAESESRAYTPYTGTVDGCYVSVTPTSDSQSVILEWAAKLGFGLTPLQQEMLHCTVINSKVDQPGVCESDATELYTGRLLQFEFWEGFDRAGYLVAVLASPDLNNRHSEWLHRGATHVLQTYTPHVTLVTGLSCSAALYKRMMRLSNIERGTLLRFNNEQIEDQIDR